MKEGWMKSDEGWMKNDERWMIKDEGCWFQAVEGFWFMTDGRTDICDCRVAFATENSQKLMETLRNWNFVAHSQVEHCYWWTLDIDN